MGHVWFGVFGLFSLNILLYCGHAQDALLRIEPNWSPLFVGETVTFICDSREGNHTDWDYSLWGNGYALTNQRPENRFTSRSLSKGDTGEYQCVAHHKIRPNVRRESNKVSLTVSGVPRPVLTVSQSWTRPADSVTLTCSVEPPSAGWRFFWYKAVRKPSLHYTYELLPGSTTGTEQHSYILHGQTHTARYVCRAGRGHPVFYTPYSREKSVWSGGVNPAASLTVSPHRLQHFRTEPLSLSCEGNSTEWRVMMGDEDGRWSPCSHWGDMTGSTCNTDTRATSGVYWCESETQSSNPANITITHRGDVILVSPVRPVTEGHSVTLGCKLRTDNLLYNVDFYKNDKLILNSGTGELFIAAVNESHEGFYKCSGRKSPHGLRTLTSAQSWLSVTYPEEAASRSVFPVGLLLVVGLVSGVLLIILLLLFLCRYRKSKGSSLSRTTRSQRTNQNPAADHVLTQDETKDKQHSSLLHGKPDEADEGPVYSDVRIRSAADESSLTYSVVEVKNPKMKGKPDEADEGTVYSDVRIRSAAGDSVTYAQVNRGVMKVNQVQQVLTPCDESSVSIQNKDPKS